MGQIEADLDGLAGPLSACTLRDRARLGAALAGVRRRAAQGREFDQSLNRLMRDIDESKAARAQRLANLPKPTFPEELPVAAKRAEIAETIAKNQVVVIAGETGSGKTTQLPKICLELGRGVDGLIGHTQPRRIAARAVAKRIAEELDTPIGQAVGYKVRFSDKLSENTYIKLMTDGILLAETQHDRMLEQYDTIIIDEAHERSLNIDFLLGYLKQLLPKRPDLKLIITSATIDPQRFSRHFGDCPFIEVSGRMYPVETRYRPLRADEPDEEDIEQIEGILRAVDELAREAASGDVLVFLSGEREIRETVEALRKHHPPTTEILPLYARLSAEEQMRVFAPHGRRRIVLATNVAETSLTVPGIKYVIDPGLARISRYSPGRKVQRLPIERISRASAEQRKGRCGRVSEGVCIRLYSEEDFSSREQFTEPEILRTNLASVILQMKALKLGEIQDFPFLDPPDYRQIRDGYQTLHELEAIDEHNQLTETGRRLSRLPVDPRLGRMILEASEEDVLDEVLIIAAALSIQDPRERPLEKQESADAAHVKFADERSDFLSYLKLWRFYHEQAARLSNSKLRRACKENFVSYVRMREWEDVHQQLTGLTHEVLPWRHHRRQRGEPRRQPSEIQIEMSPGKLDALHRSLLAGLLSNIGTRGEAYEYLGPRGVKFNIFPGSALFKRKPAWVMAAELVETTKLYARTVAPVQPQWIERLAAHLVKKTYSEPHWQAATAHVAAYEKVTLFGLVLIARRTVHYGPIDPEVSRQIFIHHALVEGEYRSNAAFFLQNRQLVKEIQAMEAKLRRRDVLAEPETRFAFFDERVPMDIYSGPTFEKWRKYDELGNDRRLFLTPRDAMQREVIIDPAQYPDAMNVAGIAVKLSYLFEPGHRDDGITATIPLALLNQLPPAAFEWLVPGWLREKVVALMKSMPKGLRVKFVPVPEYAEQAVAAMNLGDGSLLDALALRLGKIVGETIPRDAFNVDELPDYLRMIFRIVDQQGKIVQTGRDLEAMRRELGIKARDLFATMGPPSPWVRENLTTWDFGELPQRVEIKRGGTTLLGYPAVIDAGENAALRLFDSLESAHQAMRGGLRRMFMLQLRKEVEWLGRTLPNLERMCVNYLPLGSCEELQSDLIFVIAGASLSDEPEGVRTREQFIERAAEGWRKMTAVSSEITNLVDEILTLYTSVKLDLDQPAPPLLFDDIREMRLHLASLVYPGFVAKTALHWLRRYPRYLRALSIRLTKLRNAGLARDEQAMEEVEPLWRLYLERKEKHRLDNVIDPELEQYRWMVEELRVSLFAQELKTSVPVSVKRVEQQWMRVKA